MTDGTEFRDKLKNKIQEQSSIKVLDGEAKQYNVETISTGYNISTEFDDGSRCMIGINADSGSGVFADYFNKGMYYTDILYVHPDGDGTDGSNWEHAYTTLNLAVANASDNDNDFTLILVSPNLSYDVNVAGSLVINKQVHIRGHRYGFTRFENNHASATAVFTITKPCILEDFSVECSTGSNDGIVYDTGSEGTETRSVMIYSQNVTGTNSGFKLQDCAKSAFDEAMVVGNPTYTTGVEVISSLISRFDDIRTYMCNVGIHFNGVNSSYGVISSMLAAMCGTGIKIDAGTLYLTFIESFLYQNTTNINDVGTDISWNKIHTDPCLIANVFPDDFNGITITAGEGANNWCDSPVQIRSAAEATKPFYITGFIFEESAQENYGLRLSDDGGGSWFWQGIIERAVDRSWRIVFSERVFIRQGTAIHGCVKSESGGNNMKVWLKILEI